MNSNNSNIENDRSRTQQVLDKIDALEQAARQLSQTNREIVMLNIELEQMRADPSYTHCFDDETQHYLNVSRELRSTSYKWEHALNFMKECVDLRHNKDRKEQVVYFINRPPINYGRVIRNLLCQTTCMTQINLQLNNLIGPDEDRVDENVHAVREYIQTNPTLRTVSLVRDTTRDAQELATKFLQSIGRNKCIEMVHCALISPPVALHMLLSRSSSIQSLWIDCHGWNGYSLPGRDLLPLAIANSRSVVRLQLSSIGDDCIMMNSIIENLTQSHTPLAQLVIGLGMIARTNAEPLPALVSFLEQTTTLQHIEFELYNLDTNNIECILEGLRQHYNSSRLNTITKLSFQGCEFNDQAAAKFVRFMQSPTHGVAALQELELQFCLDNDDATVMFAGVPLGAAMAALISRVATTDSHLSAGGRVPTIGSQLQRLSLDPFCEMAEFLTAIRSQAHEIDLSKLCLSDLGKKECVQLNKCVPYLRSLRELHLDQVASGEVAPGTILAIYRQSGSLESASVLDWWGKKPFLTAPHVRILEAYCERNRYLWKMLSQKTLWSWSDSALHGHIKKKRRRHTKVLNPDKYDHALLLPMLLQAAKQVPSARGSTILSAMLGFEVVDS